MEYEEEANNDFINSIMLGLKGNIMSPVSDCNSNNLSMPKENLLCSTDSVQECPNSLQDNSDYQWFLDYGYRDNNYSHPSILSLSRSQDLIYYENVARNIDANLAEVDMDNFNREDIHSVLSSLPNIQGIEEREMFASVSNSMIVKLGFDESISPHCSSKDEPNGTSLCQSQLLFSPIHESYLPNTNLSIDSLDLSENDINLMLTCQANKNNYTIAFEGSTVMEADDSESRGPGTSQESRSEENEVSRFNSENIARNEYSNTMARSDSTFTTWSKIKKDSSENLQLRRHPSGNNNTNATIEVENFYGKINNSSTTKSLSLPNLFRENQRQFSGLSISTQQEKKFGSSFNFDQKYTKLYDIQKSCDWKSASPSNSSGKSHNFSLLKLFIKQKSGSNERMLNQNTNDPLSLSFLKSNKIKGLQEDDILKNIEGNNKTLDFIYSTNLFEGNEIRKNEKNILNKFEGEIPENKAPKKEIKKLSGNFNHEKQKYDFNFENKYSSDDSTQENGSNTESAEYLACNCTKLSKKSDLKKPFSEKGVQTSKVSETSNENITKANEKVPVYILYPNYALPDLEFLKKKHYVQNLDFSKIFVKPQKFKMPASQVSNSESTPKRPFSVNDIESLKKTGFKHVRDWDSLTFLLPLEYKEFLQEIPEIVSQLKEIKNVKQELVPLFCLSPPPNRKMKRRPISCDLNFFYNESRGSNFSSTATQPSSGYRGSSTMLNSNNSGSVSSPRNNCSESSSSRKSSSFLRSRNYSRNLSETPPPRPPLPKGILRNYSLDNQQYTCKTQKEYANKRYSMIELPNRNWDYEEKYVRRRPSQNAVHSRDKNSDGKIVNASDLSTNANKESDENYYSSEQTKLQNDMRRLEELLEISAVFGEPVESFTESDMIRLRSQVSKFLAMHQNLEKVSETLQTVNENLANEDNNCDANCSSENKSLHTPHNTPEHKRQTTMGQNMSNLLNSSGKDDQYFSSTYSSEDFEEEKSNFNEEVIGGLKKTVSFAERISFAVKSQELENERTSSRLLNQKIKCKRPVTLPICEESTEGPLNFSPAREMQISVELSRKRGLLLDVKNAVEKVLKLYEEGQDPVNICLHQLCPSLYAVLNDGLKDEINTPFGPIKNSVWGVIEASSQKGPMTQTLNELVQRLNRDDIFTEGLIKFNAFVFGLLNARALSGWLSYLRTRDNLLRKYYDHSGFLLMSNSSGASFRILVDQLILILEALCSVRFNLDLMYQTKLLHSSLQNLNHLLEDADNNDFLTPTKQFMLLKLVQSIQNSISQSGERKKGKQLFDDIEEKTSDPPVASLLEKNKVLRTRSTANKMRPRSGCEILELGDKDVTDVNSTMKKRWSGVNLNSKLFEAYEKLAEDSESDYTDSLDNRKPRKKLEKSSSAHTVLKKSPDSSPDKLEYPSGNSIREQKKVALSNRNKKVLHKRDDCKTDLEVDGRTSPNSSGHKFKRLQQKWEKLSGTWSIDEGEKNANQENVPSRKSSIAPAKSPKSPKPDKYSCDTNMPSPTGRISKIPRLVTSPLSSAPTTKLSGTVRKLQSPTSSNPASARPRTGKSSNAVKTPVEDSKASLASRLTSHGEKSLAKGSSEMGQGVRPTSLPYRGCNTMPTKKKEAISKRVSSLSLNRKTIPKKLQLAERTVRTLTHRLPSDSGHLPFNADEKLKVLFEVDKTWLLCCRGSQKGLVPKSAVISDIEDSKY